MSSSTIVARDKGLTTTAHNAIAATATSNVIDCTGFTGLLVHTTITGTGTWKIDLKGAPESNVSFVDMYDNNDSQLTTGNLTASRHKLFVGIPDFVKILATEVADGATCTVKVTPIII